MEKNSRTIRTAFAASLAALLLVTPPAGAAAADRRRAAASQFQRGWSLYQKAFARGVDQADFAGAQAAVAAYEAALRLDPSLSGLSDPSQLHFSMAMCEEVLGSYEKALASYKAAYKAAPSKPLLPLHAARLRLKMGDGAKALSNVELAMKKAMSSGREAALREAARRDPSFKALLAYNPCRKALGLAAADDGALLAAEIRSDELRDAVRDVPAMAPVPSPDARTLAKAAEGDVEFKLRRYESAAQAYREALRADQDRMALVGARTAQIYENLGASYNKLGQPEIALRALRQSLQLKPSNPSALYQTALAYAADGRSAEALKALRESFKACAARTELRRLVMLSKTDAELEAVRDLPGYRAALAEHADRVALR